MVLFKRHMALNALMSWVLLGAGWFLVAFVVAIGPLAIETSGRGSYFGPSGFWYTYIKVLVFNPANQAVGVGLRITIR